MLFTASVPLLLFTSLEGGLPSNSYGLIMFAVFHQSEYFGRKRDDHHNRNKSQSRRR